MEYTNEPVPKIKAVRKAAPLEDRPDLRGCKPSDRRRKTYDSQIEKLTRKLDHLETVVNALQRETRFHGDKP